MVFKLVFMVLWKECGIILSAVLILSVALLSENMVYEISFTNDDGTMQFYVGMTNRNLKLNTSNTRELRPDYTSNNLYRLILKI